MNKIGVASTEGSNI